jgi:hypothetical protein
MSCAWLIVTPHDNGNKFHNGEFPVSSSHSKGTSNLLRLCLIYAHVSTCRVNLHRISSAIGAVNTDTLLIWSIDSFIFHRPRLGLTDPSSPFSHPSRKRSRRVSSPVASLSNSFTTVVMTELDGVHGTVCNPQQYQQSQQSHDSRSPSISCLTRGQSIGLVVGSI